MNAKNIRVMGSFDASSNDEDFVNHFYNIVVIPANITNIKKYLLKYANNIINKKYSFDILNSIIRIKKIKISLRFLFFGIYAENNLFLGTWMTYNSQCVDSAINYFDRAFIISRDKISIENALNIRQGIFSVGNILNDSSLYHEIFEPIGLKKNRLITTVFSATQKKMYVLIVTTNNKYCSI